MSSEMLLADKYLSIINGRGSKALPLKRVYHNMRQRGLFLKAYENLYPNKGATTLGTDVNDTIQGMSLERIDAIIQKLANGSFQWGPARRIYIPKANGEKRPLAIPSWSDKLVQEVIRLILEVYFEPQFRPSSHGFRPNHSCHTALEHIKKTWTGTKWFIEGDIKGCFDNLSHQLILKLLGKYIEDRRFLKLIRQMLEAGYVEDWQYQQSFSGVPQGGVVSPILSNLVLHELDIWMEDKLIPQYNQGKRRKASSEHARLRVRRSWAKQKGKWELYSQLGKELHKIPSMAVNDPDFRRLYYCRYADDFLLGYIGTIEEAKQIKQQIKGFLNNLELELSEEKTFITHARTQTACFLGYNLHVSWDDQKRSRNKNGNKRRSINGKVQLTVPHKVVTEWKRKYSYKGKARYIARLQSFSDYEIVSTYGAQLRGLVNYYRLAFNLSQKLEVVRWFCMESCRKTLAKKHRLNKRNSYRRYISKESVRRKHIKVSLERPNKKPLIARCGELSLKYQKYATYVIDAIPSLTIVGRQKELTKRLLAEKCELCGVEHVPLEAHHVNKLKNLKRRWQGRKSRPAWVQWMIARQRKTLFVCQSCHQDITYGRYDGAKIC